MPDLSDPAILFWEHARGDPTTLPCLHIVFEHPQGDTVMVPCTHGLVQQHPGGDPVTTPCTHLVQVHPGGDALTVPCTHGLTQAHPAGDRVGFVTIPCIHVSLTHPEGDTITVPCPHLTQQHPGGDTNFLPCTHVSLVHPEGDPVIVPCVHPRQEHPEGHPGPPLPCTHPLPVVREEFGGGLKFYTDQADLQARMIAVVQAMLDLGVNVMSIRPLHVFNRDALNGNPWDNHDPFWSHYNQLFHSIQLTKGHGLKRNMETVLHEMGHAILGHSIPSHFAGGPHNATRPIRNADGTPNLGLAMSEGWAEFVGLVIEERAGIGTDRFAVGVLEDPPLEPDPSMERCVAAVLWDLYDPTGQDSDGPDRVSLPFGELFRVYSPSLETLLDGPVVSSIYAFADRLKKNNPRNRSLPARIDEVVERNVGPRP